MGEKTGIAWCHHTFNPWWGCTKVSPGCERCYAERLAQRFGVKWGPDGERKMFGDEHWKEPRKWNRYAAQAGERRRVFSASMADVFELRPELDLPRLRLFQLITETPALDWLLLTKRPENIKETCFARGFPENVWLGTTVENEKTAEERLPHLLGAPTTRYRFVSYEPALGAVDFEPWLDGHFDHLACALVHHHQTNHDISGHGDEASCEECSLTWTSGIGIDWIIVGGESGPGARPFAVSWAEDVLRQCRRADVPAFMKQLGSRAVLHPTTARNGDDPSEWPEKLRVQEVPR